MATARKKQAPQSATVRKPVEKKLTRKEKSEQNKARYRAAQKEVFAKIAAEKPKIIRTRTGHSLVVRDGDNKRPTEYDPVIARQICVMFATDPNMNLLVLNNTPTLPTTWTFYEWLEDHPEFAEAYTRAREIHTDVKAADLERLAAEPMIGETVTTRVSDKDGTTVETRRHDNVDRARLIVETRKWTLSKDRPKKYGVTPAEVDDNGALKDLLAQFRARSAELEAE